MSIEKKRVLHIFLFSLLIIVGTFSITFMVKSFNEWNRSFGSYKPEIMNAYIENKSTFTDMVSYVQSVNSEVSIENGNGTNYKSYTYNGGISYYTIDDDAVDNNLRRLFKEKFDSINKDDTGSIYFIYRSVWGGAQGIAYTDDPQKLYSYYEGMQVEKIEGNWYYFLGQ